MNTHKKYIRRCIQLAQNGRGKTYPNPLVGSVIVYQNKIIGEGWHQKAGKAHAEVNAINSVNDKSLLKKATIYVSLEPCSHTGKTPPCSDLIIKNKIKKVVIGTIDPFAKVAGRGIKKLMAAKCDVVLGVLEEECKALNKRFFTFHQQKRPYIILKWAQSKDGFIAPLQQNERVPFWISNTHSKQLVHKWRAEEQAILVGTTTAVKDNPKLNTRLWKGSNPVRVVIDLNLRIPKNSHIFDGSVKTIVISKKHYPETALPLSENLIIEPVDTQKSLAKEVCNILYRHNLQSVIIEGGKKTLQTFIDAKLWDEARIITGDIRLEKGINAPVLPKKEGTSTQIDSDKFRVIFRENF